MGYIPQDKKEKSEDETNAVPETPEKKKSFFDYISTGSQADTLREHNADMLARGYDSTDPSGSVVMPDDSAQEPKKSPAPAPGKTNGGAEVEILNRRCGVEEPSPSAPLKKTIDHGDFTNDYSKYLLDRTQYVAPEKEVVDRHLRIADNRPSIDEAFAKMKELAWISPEKYKKDFMKDNYQGFQAVSDILSGLRQGLTGNGGGQTNADRVNAALAEKLNALRDKNQDTQTQLGLEQQKAGLGEGIRVANENAEADYGNAVEGTENKYKHNVDMINAMLENKQNEMNAAMKTDTEKLDAAKQTAIDQSENAFQQQNADYHAKLTKHFALFNSDLALQSELDRMEAKGAINRANAKRYMDILDDKKNGGREKMLLAMAADMGSPLDLGPLTSEWYKFLDRMGW